MISHCDEFIQYKEEIPDDGKRKKKIAYMSSIKPAAGVAGVGARRAARRRGNAVSAAEAARKALCEEAWGHLRATKYPEALAAFNAALDLNAEDKSALVARSQCHLLLGQPQKALEDAEAALTIDPSFVRGVLQKAEALYHLGDFEYSLVYFHRGLRARPEMRQFKLGVQKAQEAIENVIGDNKQVFPTSPRQLRKMIKYFKEKQGEKAPTSEASRTNLFAKDKKKKNPAAVKRIEKHILGDLYQDKRYLEELLNNTEVLSLKQDFANDDIAQHAQEGIAYLKTRQEFWRQQKSSMPRRRRSPSVSPRPPSGTGSRIGSGRVSANGRDRTLSKPPSASKSQTTAPS